MGYYTQYEGSIYSSDWEVVKKWEPLVGKSVAALEYFVDTVADIETVDSIQEAIGYDAIKWYSWQRDMIEVSKQFPEVVIKLHGEGEDSEDIWDAYFKNGKMVRYMAEIHIPSFDENDLE